MSTCLSEVYVRMCNQDSFFLTAIVGRIPPIAKRSPSINRQTPYGYLLSAHLHNLSIDLSKFVLRTPHGISVARDVDRELCFLLRMMVSANSLTRRRDLVSTQARVRGRLIHIKYH